MNHRPTILPDSTALQSRLEALEAENARLRKGKSELSIDWVEGKKGRALSLTWPGRRSRYLEVGEFRDLVAKAEEVEKFINEQAGGKR
jgi:hypothetical protein